MSSSSSSSSSSSGGNSGNGSSSSSSSSKSKAKPQRSCFGPECDLPGPDGAVACPPLHSYEYARSLPASCYPTEGNPLYLQPQTEGGQAGRSAKKTKGPLNWSSNWPKPKWALDNNGKDDDFGEGQDVFFPTNKGAAPAASAAAATSPTFTGASTTAAAGGGGGNSGSGSSSSKAPSNVAASSSSTANTGPPSFAFGLPPKGLAAALPGMKFLSIQEGADGKLVAVENTPPSSILSSADMLAASNKQHLTDAMLMRGKPEWAEQEVELMRKISELPNKPTLEQVKEATLPTLIERGYSYAEASMLFDRFYKTSDESSKKDNKSTTRTPSENKPVVASSQLKSKDGSSSSGSSSSSSRLREEALAMQQNEAKEDVEAANEFIRSHVASLEASKAQLLSEKEALDAEINALRKQKNDLEAVPKPSRSKTRDQELQQTAFGIYIRGGIAEPILEAPDDEAVPVMYEGTTNVHVELGETENTDVIPFKRYLVVASSKHCGQAVEAAAPGVEGEEKEKQEQTKQQPNTAKEQ